jgi:hypothetical protein
MVKRQSGQKDVFVISDSHGAQAAARPSSSESIEVKAKNKTENIQVDVGGGKLKALPVDSEIKEWMMGGDGDVINEWGNSHEGDSSDEDILIAKKITKLMTGVMYDEEKKERINELLLRVEHIKSMPAESAYEAMTENSDIVRQISEGDVDAETLVILWNMKRRTSSRRKLWHKDALGVTCSDVSITRKEFIRRGPSQ